MTENAIVRSRGERPEPRLTRRRFLVGIGGAAAAGLGVGGVAGWVIRDSRGARWPDQVVLGNAGELAAEINETGAPLIRPEAWSPTLAVIRWNPSLPGALNVYREHDHAVIDDDHGLMALNLRDPHCGCRNHWCPTSQWFENPCHGEKHNRWGEWTGGPSPRGLDRYASRVEGGQYVVDLDHLLIGPARDARVLDQEPAGRHCVD